MIEAFFDRNGRSALITGAYQYDKGQRLKLIGLPAPEELAEMDDMLSGEEVTVSVHYSRPGDPQAVATLAIYDEYRGEWLASIPDEILTRSAAVNVQVYAYYGAEGEQERGKTMYEGVFTPIYRAAPNDTVSDDQLARWAALEQEVQLALAPSETATALAAEAADIANAASDVAGSAAAQTKVAAATVQEALQELLRAEEGVRGLKFVITRLAPGSAATAEKSGDTITLGIPKGEGGEKGLTGDTGPSDISFSMADGVLTITPNREV